MKIICCIAALLMAVAAEQYINQETYDDNYPEWYAKSLLRTRRQADTYWKGEHKVGDGKVFGQLGGNDAMLYGKGGYERNIFDNNHGTLDGSVHGTRVLSPYGDSSHLGGGLKWHDDHARAAVDVSRQIHGATSLDASAGGRWPLGKNGAAFADGTYSQTFGGRGGRDYGVRGGLEYRF